MHVPFLIRDTVREIVPLKWRNRFNSYLWKRLNLNHYLADSDLYIRVTNLADWAIYNEIFVSGEYDVPINHAITNARGRINVLDIGANVGFFSLRFVHLLRQKDSSRVFHVTLSEGSPYVVRELEERMKLNRLSNIKIVQGLVGKRSGNAKMCESEFHAQNSIMGNTGLTLEFIDLDLELDNSPIDLLKCDIEGAELLFIETYPEILRRTRLAVFEFHPAICDANRCISIMRGLGFESVKLREDNENSVYQFSRQGNTHSNSPNISLGPHLAQ